MDRIPESCNCMKDMSYFEENTTSDLSLNDAPYSAATVTFEIGVHGISDQYVYDILSGNPHMCSAYQVCGR